MKASIKVTITADTTDFEEGLDLIIEIIGLPEEEAPTEDSNGQDTD